MIINVFMYKIVQVVMINKDLLNNRLLILKQTINRDMYSHKNKRKQI